MRLLGDFDTELEVTATVDQDRLMLAAGSHTIGDWAFEEMQVEATDEGVVVRVEGEGFLLTADDVEGLRAQLAPLIPSPEAPRRGRRSSKKDAEKSEEKPSKRQAEKPARKREPSTQQAEMTDEPSKEKRQKAPRTARQSAYMRSRFEAISRGRKLAAGGIIALILLAVFSPGWAAAVLLLGGLLLLLGAVAVKTDQYMAARLPQFLSHSMTLTVGFAAVGAGIVLALVF
jgi:hypothetical protein